MGMGKKLTAFFLLVFYFIGLKLRVGGTLNGYFAFTYDQGRDFLELSKLVFGHNLSLIGPPTGIEGVFHGVWWFWVLAPVFWLWRGDPTLMVATFNVLSTLFVLVAYYIGEKIKDATLGLVLAGIVATSPAFVDTGAQLWHPNIVPLLTLLLVFALWQFIKKKRSFVWTAALLGLIWEFEFGSGGIFLPAFVFAILILKITPARKDIVPSFLAFGVWLVPRLLFELRHSFLQTKSLVFYISHTKQTEFVLPLIDRVFLRLETILSLLKNSFTGGNMEVLTGLLLLFLFAFVFLVKTETDNQEKKLIMVLFLSLELIYIAASIYPNALWNYYLIGVPAMLLMPIGWAIHWLMRQLPVIGWGVFIGLILQSSFPVFAHGESAWQGDASVFKNQLQIVDAIYQDTGDRPFNIQVYSPSVIDYTYEYLFKWRKGDGETGADRIHEQKLVYTIVEPDKWHENLQRIWLRDRDGDGTMVGSKCFLGGIDVAKKIR